MFSIIVLIFKIDMKKGILFAILLLVTFSIQVRYYEGIIKLKNGEEKTGYISSFMEYSILKKIKPGGGITGKFNMDDKMVKFKKNLKDKEFEKIFIEEVEEIMFSEGPYAGVRYRPLFIGGVNKKGKLELTKNKIWLPLLIDEKIKIYSFSYKEYNSENPADSGTYYLHFLQHQDKTMLFSLCQD